MPQVFLPKELYDGLLRAGEDPAVFCIAAARTHLDSQPPKHVKPLDGKRPPAHR